MFQNCFAARRGYRKSLSPCSRSVRQTMSFALNGQRLCFSQRRFVRNVLNLKFVVCYRVIPCRNITLLIVLLQIKVANIFTIYQFMSIGQSLHNNLAVISTLVLVLTVSMHKYPSQSC